jgi:predicted regulator of Ras-like GTPase activity (Roadblock/LC7/MglB family)
MVTKNSDFYKPLVNSLNRIDNVESAFIASASGFYMSGEAEDKEAAQDLAGITAAFASDVNNYAMHLCNEAAGIGFMLLKSGFIVFGQLPEETFVVAKAAGMKNMGEIIREIRKYAE